MANTAARYCAMWFCQSSWETDTGWGAALSRGRTLSGLGQGFTGVLTSPAAGCATPPARRPERSRGRPEERAPGEWLAPSEPECAPTLGVLAARGLGSSGQDHHRPCCHQAAQSAGSRAWGWQRQCRLRRCAHGGSAGAAAAVAAAEHHAPHAHHTQAAEHGQGRRAQQPGQPRGAQSLGSCSGQAPCAARGPGQAPRS